MLTPLCRIVIALLVTTFVGACSPVPRAPLSEDQLQARRSEQASHIRHYSREARDRYIRRMAAKVDAQGDAATIDILIISGGGDYGAFGAGVLSGWGDVPESPMSRPKFDIATGVSTGSLIAPFAFIGDADNYSRILKLYENPKDDWFSVRGLLFFLPSNSSLTDNTGLRKEVEKQIDDAVIRRIAQGHAEDRLLLIGATDLDLGIMHPWDIGTEATKITAQGREPTRLYDIIMASTAIPAVFPPVLIDGSLYVDGGATSNILYDFDLRDDDAPVPTYKKLYPGKTVPKRRFWVIVNNQLGGTPRVVEQSWLQVARVSIETAVRSSTLGALKQIALQTELQNRDGIATEFRYIAIPDSWRPPGHEPFDPETMRSLAELGRQLGRDPNSWRTDIVSQPRSIDAIDGQQGSAPK